jgi:tRNA A-37 threonylcarbamoyl transferase component Bud32
MTPGRTAETPSVGDGRYTLSERIATGGMGVVWRGHDEVLGRDVAVKILKAEYADDATFRARLQAEARNTAGLHHPAIAQVFDFGDAVDPATGRPTTYLVMELVPGEPLSAVLAREGALPPERAADVVAQAASAIDAAHERGIVHRDVKPANLLVTPTGTVKVTDFGIARAADAVPLTQTGHVIGTPHYLSPEQAHGQSATAASDIYALGVVLYECLTGSRPFTAETAVAVAMQHMRDEPPPLPGSVPAGLAAICLRALAKEQGERPESAADLARRLSEPGWRTPLPYAGDSATLVSAAAGTTQNPTGDMATGGGHTALMTSAAGPPTPTDRRRRSGWLVPLAVAAAVVLLLAGIGLALTTGDEPAPSTGGDAKAGSRAGGDGSAGQDTAPSPEPIRVDPSDYRGRPFADAAAELRGQGFEVDRAARVGDDGEPGTVDSVTPHGMLAPGTSITLGVWRAPAEDSGGADAGTAPEEDQGDGGGSGEPEPGKSEKKGKSEDKGKSEEKGKSEDKGDGGLLDLSSG